MIQLSHFSYKIQDKVLFNQVNTTFEENIIHTIYGNNGIGKTTFFNILTGKYRDFEGDILIQNHSIKSLNAMQLADFISICYASQPKSELFVNEVFSFSNISKIDKEEIYHLFELKEFSNKNIQALSEGERQWIFIARAMARKSVILLLDEPTAFLDLNKRRKLKEILELTSQTKTILINTHDEYLSNTHNNTSWSIENQNFNQILN